MVTVNYYPTIKMQTTEGDYFAPDAASLDLVPYDYDMSYESGKCPSQKEHWKNTWTIKAPFNIQFDYWKKLKKIGPHNMTTQAWDDLFDFASGSTFDGTHPEFQIKIQYLMWTDKPNIWVEMRNTMEMAKQDIELVEGCFSISAWTRPLNLGVRLHRDGKFDLKTGMPLAHVKISDRDNWGNIRLVKADKVPEKLLKKWDQDARYTQFHPHKAWSLIKKRVKNGFRFS